jgi:hypothetical protein
MTSARRYPGQPPFAKEFHFSSCSLLWKTDFLNQRLKPRVVAQRIVARVALDGSRCEFAVFVRLVQFGQGFVLFAERRIKSALCHGELIRMFLSSTVLRNPCQPPLA